MTEIPGIETIQGLVGEPPNEIPIPYNIIHTEELLRQGWNALHIAILPYCFTCKEPLVWHSPPTDNILFHCPKCGRKWIRDDEWQRVAWKEKPCAKC